MPDCCGVEQESQCSVCRAVTWSRSTMQCLQGCDVQREPQCRNVVAWGNSHNAAFAGLWRGAGATMPECCGVEQEPQCSVCRAVAWSRSHNAGITTKFGCVSAHRKLC
eukprot:1158858-Pelagomonas_calceolata.AAC.4